MSVSSCGWSSRYFDTGELSMDHFGVDGVRSEKSESVGQFTLFVLSSEEVDAFLHGVRFIRGHLASIADVATSSLDEWSHTVLYC